MALDYKNLVVRSLSGLVYVGLIIGAIVWGSFGLPLLTSILVVAASFELENNTIARHNSGNWTYTWLIDAAMLVALQWVFYIKGTVAPEIVWVVLMLLRFILQIFIEQNKPLRSISISVFSQLYLGFPLMMLVAGREFVSLNPWVLVCAIAMIWINDTGAYLVGSLFGRHKLIPRLSPNKSWEGFLGGLLFNFGFAFIFFYCFKLNQYPVISNVQGWIFIGICVTVMATLGDLFESMLKRSLGIKDFSNFIPGHGGVLDRIDSLLFVIPGVALLVLLGSDMFIPL